MHVRIVILQFTFWAVNSPLARTSSLYPSRSLPPSSFTTTGEGGWGEESSFSIKTRDQQHKDKHACNGKQMCAIKGLTQSSHRRGNDGWMDHTVDTCAHRSAHTHTHIDMNMNMIRVHACCAARPRADGRASTTLHHFSIIKGFSACTQATSWSRHQCPNCAYSAARSCHPYLLIHLVDHHYTHLWL